MALAEHLHPKTYWELRCELLEEALGQFLRVISIHSSPRCADEMLAVMRDWQRLIGELGDLHPAPAAGVKANAYRCGHCGYEGPCYGTPTGNGVSAPWCKRCQRNDKLEATNGVPPSAAPVRMLRADKSDNPAMWAGTRIAMPPDWLYQIGDAVLCWVNEGDYYRAMQSGAIQTDAAGVPERVMSPSGKSNGGVER